MYKRYQKKDYPNQHQPSGSSRGRGRGGRGRGSSSRGRGRGSSSSYYAKSGGYSEQQPHSQYVPKESQYQQKAAYPSYGEEEYYEQAYGDEYYQQETYYDQEVPQQQQYQQKEQYQPKAQYQQESHRKVEYKPKEESKSSYYQSQGLSTTSQSFVPKSQSQYAVKEQPSQQYQPKQQHYESYQDQMQYKGYEQQFPDYGEEDYALMYGDEYGREKNDYYQEEYFDEATTQDSRQTKSTADYDKRQPEYFPNEEETYEDQTQLNEISNYNYCQGTKTEQLNSPCNVLMVAEKPSIALSITEALSKSSVKKKGFAKQIPIYNFQRDFMGMRANINVTSVAGHVYNRDFPKQYQNRRADPVVLYDAPTVRNVDKQARPILKHLQMVSRNVDFIVLWLDCDKEGENICYEVLDICRRNIPKSKLQRVFRAKFSSIAKKDIEMAYNSLNSGPNYNESVSVDARQIMDLKIGVSFSRYQTQYLAPLLKQSGLRMVTYGPCQTPTLGFCVDQAERIKKFIPEPFWKIEPVINDKDTIKGYPLKWQRGKIYDRTVARILHSSIQMCKQAEVIDVKKSKVTQVRPMGLNTVKMLKVASKSFGMSAHDTMHTAERLYLSGYITYPRTESTTFSSNFNFKEILQQHQGHPEWGTYVSQLLKQGFNKPRKGVDQGDHPPITPIKSASKGSLGDREWRLYSFITRNFLGCLSRDAEYDQVEVWFSVGSEDFKLKGQILLEPGFLDIMPWHLQSDKEIPVFKIGQQVDIKTIKLVDGKTSPPGYLTEAKLISLMEKNGIGTDASIPTHINNIIDRQYVHVREPGRSLVPSPLGLALVKGYCQIDPELVLPSIRSNIEKSCDMIAKGKADFSRVLTHVLSMFKKKFEFFKLSIGTMEKLMFITFAQQQKKYQDIFLKSKIPKKEEEQKSEINFCIKCFKGYLTLQYHKQKGFGLKCDNCKFRVTLPFLVILTCQQVQICVGASKVIRDSSKCDECDSYKLTATYKDNSPFPGEQNTYTGCILCNPVMNQLIVNFFQKKQTKQESEMTEEEKKAKEERIQKKKEEKKAMQQLKEEEKKKEGNVEGEKKKKKKEKKKVIGPDDMTDQERMNEFMKKFA